ncbi:unnamed protein product [Urochloa decumbens]|uniref:Uncharacterized protein n=1 Tax=Urochloa decumbens TaxID=240449 RepID=A0ABC9BAT6_9POAL
MAGRMRRARVEAPMTASRVPDPRPEVTLQDAARFVTALKRDLAGEPGRYEEVFAVMRQFRDGSLETEGVVDRIKVLLSGHPGLIHAFNQFLPWGYIRAQGSAGAAVGSND